MNNYRVYSYTKFMTTVESVDAVMKQHGLTTLSELGEKLGIYLVDRRLRDGNAKLRSQWTYGRAPETTAALSKLFYSKDCYVPGASVGGSLLSASTRLCRFAGLDDEYSDDFDLLYPGTRHYKNGSVNAFRYILRDFPEKVNKDNLYAWASENPLYGWAIYKLLGEPCPKDSPIAYLYENDGAERTILLPDRQILDDIWQARLKEDASDESLKDNIWLCHIERLIVRDKLGRVSDLVLVLEVPKRFFSFGASHKGLMGIGMIAVTLFVDRKWTSVPPVMYHKVFTVDEYTDVNEMYPSPCRELACRFVEEKTGIHFENFYRGSSVSCTITTKGFPHGVFPCVKVGHTSASDAISSQAYIEHDIDAPSYISFVGDETLDLSKADGKRLGTVVSFFKHGTIGFWKMPAKKYVTENGEHFDKDTELMSYLNENLREDVSLLAYSEEDAGRLSENYMNNCIGMATKLIIDHNPLLALQSVPIFYLSANNVYDHLIHDHFYYRKAVKWEPNDTTSVPLDSLKEVFVTLIAADDSSGEPEIFYVLSESDRWYEYSYCNCEEGELTPSAIKKMTVHGLADESVVLSSVTKAYQLAKHSRWEYTSNRGFRQYRLTYAAEFASYSASVKTLLPERQPGMGRTIGRALSMASDMRVVWRTLTEKHKEFEQHEPQTKVRPL